MKIFSRGAEAVIFSGKNLLVKKRNQKGYRLKEIDEKIRKLRTRSEAKILQKASEVIPVPRLIKVDENEKSIFIELIKGKKISESLENFPLKKQKKIFEEIGKNVSKLHDKDIIHGDLTTSNMIYVNKNEKDFKVYFIDFGLGFISNKIEDKAVDVYLLKQALEAKHFKSWKEIFNAFLIGYSVSEKSKDVFEKLKKVEMRGRYKSQY